MGIGRTLRRIKAIRRALSRGVTLRRWHAVVGPPAKSRGSASRRSPREWRTPRRSSFSRTTASTSPRGSTSEDRHPSTGSRGPVGSIALARVSPDGQVQQITGNIGPSESLPRHESSRFRPRARNPVALDAPATHHANTRSCTSRHRPTGVQLAANPAAPILDSTPHSFSPRHAFRSQIVTRWQPHRALDATDQA
ncbi:MAG: hypothetical protein QOK19_2156 [Solirubrobacteraceae bacterium]|nr:hypothetical protein [Solirubrobacteraceae bacterium]